MIYMPKLWIVRFMLTMFLHPKPRRASVTTIHSFPCEIIFFISSHYCREVASMQERFNLHRALYKCVLMLIEYISRWICITKCEYRTSTTPLVLILDKCQSQTYFGCRSCDKTIERHTVDTIVSWPNPKQWVIVHTSDLMMIKRQSTYIISIIARKMDKLKTNSPTYCIMDNGDNMLNLTHTLDKIYLTGIL